MQFCMNFNTLNPTVFINGIFIHQYSALKAGLGRNQSPIM